MMEIVKTIVAEICERKQRQRIVPAVATTIDIQQALIQRGAKLTPESWKAILLKLEADTQVKVVKLLRFNGYRLIDHADDAEADAQSVPTTP